MKVAVIGYGVEGRSAVTHWQAKGAEVTVCDQNEAIEVPSGVNKQVGSGYLTNLAEFDVINRTGSIHPKMLLAANTGIESKITTIINEFFRVSPTRNIIGVTGTKGKGTTSTLITKMLQAAGKKVFLAGNIGNSPLDFLGELTEESWVVLELSSYQLYDLKQSPLIGVCLMVVPEHLNWHGSMEDYVYSKQQLFAHQAPTDTAIYYADNETSHTIASASPGKKIPYYAEPGAYVKDNYITIDARQLCGVEELKLLGKHNWQNVCAAVTAVWQITQDTDAIRSVLTTFRGLPHRIEFVREINSVRFYNDSFAAGLHATEAAVEAIEGPKVLIVGGFDRFLPIEHFGTFAKEHAKELAHILLIGQSARRVADELEKAGYHGYKISTAKNMAEIVAEAHQLAKGGDAILLSPGFASFGLFNNFEDRGNQFKEVVNTL